MRSPSSESPIRSSLLETLVCSSERIALNESLGDRSDVENYDSQSQQHEDDGPDPANDRNSRRPRVLVSLQRWLVSLASGIILATSIVPLLGLMYSLRNVWFQDLNDASLFWPVISTIGGFVSAFLAEILPNESRNNSISTVGRKIWDGKQKPLNQAFLVFSSFVAIATGAPLGPELILLSWGLVIVTMISNFEKIFLQTARTNPPIVSRRMMMILLGSIGGILLSSPVLAVVLSYEGWIIVASQKTMFDARVQTNPPTHGRNYNDMAFCITAATSAYIIAQLFSLDSLLAPEWYPNWDLGELRWKSWYFPLSIALGISCGIVGFVFVSFLRCFSYLRVTGCITLQQYSWIPKWFGVLLFPTLSGSIHGCLCLWNPAMVGIGFSSLGEIITKKAPFDILHILIMGATKMVSLSLCLGFGWIGGPVFPLLFIGACFGIAVSAWIPLALAVPCCMCAIVGSIIPFPLSLIFFLVGSMSLSFPVAGAALIATVVAQTLIEGLNRATGLIGSIWNDTHEDHIEESQLESAIDSDSDERVFMYDELHEEEEDESLVQAVRAAVYGSFR